MAKYCKKPVVIEAISCAEILKAMEGNWEALPKWVANAYENGTIRAITAYSFVVETLEGQYTAWHTDMLIKGVKGELYPCKPDIFRKSYEPVKEIHV